MDAASPEQHRREALRLYKVGLMVSRSMPSRADRRRLFTQTRAGFRACSSGGTPTAEDIKMLCEFEERVVTEFARLPIAVRRWLLERPCFAPSRRLLSAGAALGALVHRQSFRPLALMAVGGGSQTTVLEESLRGSRVREDSQFKDIVPGTPLPPAIEAGIREQISWQHFDAPFWENNPKPWEAWGVPRDYHPTESEFKVVAQRRMDAVKTLEMLYYEKPTPDRAKAVWDALPRTYQADMGHSFDAFHDKLLQRMRDNPVEVFDKMCAAEAAARAKAAGAPVAAGASDPKLIGVPSSARDALHLDAPTRLTKDVMNEVESTLAREEGDALRLGTAPAVDRDIDILARARTERLGLGGSTSQAASLEQKKKRVEQLQQQSQPAAATPRRSRTLRFGERAEQVKDVISRYKPSS